jgi:2-iminobutanoate/2-iminopropanoate deaminase
MTMRRTPAAKGTYSDAISVDGPGRWIHIAGQVGVDFDGVRPPGGMREQSDVLFDLVRTTVFVTSFDDYADFAAVRAQRLGGVMPTSSAVQVVGLMGGALVEVDATAFVPAN